MATSQRDYQGMARSLRGLEHDIEDPPDIEDEIEAVFGARDKWYVGKEYKSGDTEIISMGLQQLYKDPLLFARNDPE